MEDSIHEIDKMSRPMRVINWIFGIGVIECPFGKKHPVVSLFYSAIVLSSYIILSVYTFPDMMTLAQEFKTRKTVMKFFLGANVFITITVIVLGWKRSKESHIFIEELAHVDNLLVQMGLSRNYRKLLKSEWIIFAIQLLFLLLTLIIASFELYNNSSISIGFKVLNVVVHNYPFVCMFIVDATFIGYGKFCHHFLHVTNQALKSRLSNISKYPLHHIIMKNVLNGNEISEHNTTDNINEEGFFIVQTSKSVHMKLVKECKILDDTFALHILFSIAFAIGVITGSLYENYEYFFLTTRHDNQSLYYWLPIRSAVLVVYSFSKLCSYSYHCSTISAESVVTGDILSEYYDDPSISEETQKEIRNFLIQLIDSPLQFKTYGFSILNYSLILSIISLVTTYLMILIQFKVKFTDLYTI